MKAVRIITIGTAFGLASCTSYQQQAGVVGGIAGALAGAAFGDDHQDVIAGAAVGAGIGAGAAAIHENEVRKRQYRDGRDYDRYGMQPDDQQVYEPAPRERAPRMEDPEPENDYPTAQRSEVSGQVISPYPPHRKIDVTGFSSGQLAKDPTSGEIFRVP